MRPISRNLNTPFSKFKKEVRRFELEAVSAFCMGYTRFGTTLVECTLTISTETLIRILCIQNTSFYSEHNVYFWVWIFVHFFYRGYLRISKMSNYLNFFMMHKTKIIVMQPFHIKICLFLYAYVCLSFDTDDFGSNDW